VVERILLGLSLLGLMSGCSGILVGASVVTVGGAAVLGFECPTYVTVTVRDGSTGRELCNAPVVFEKGTSSRELAACGSIGLDPGNWRVRPALPGYVGESSSLVLEAPKDCEHVQYSIELTVWPQAGVR
jgi:hypothetical protein